MTIYNKATLKTYFETGDVPDGGDYANFIDSCVNLAETAIQSMSGSLSPTELITPRVSATNVNVTGIMSAVSLISTLISADTLNATTIVNTNITTTTVSSDVVYASAARLTGGSFYSIGIVSAAGTTQGAATVFTSPITRGQGSVDGSTTGFAIPANRTGMIQYFIHEGAVSANLWPPTGGTINGLGANAAFALVANTPYIIIHKTASAYAVK